jgi:hypothetical protein
VAQWVSGSTFLSTLNVVQFFGLRQATTIDGVVTAQLVRHGIVDLYARYQGRNVSYSAGDLESFSAVYWASMGTAPTCYLVPYLAFWPQATTLTLTNAVVAKYLKALDKETTAAGYNWISDKYPMVVLAGIMRCASLYIGDGQAYLYWKGKYANGIKEMILMETTVQAGTPYRRSVYPEDIFRQGV